MNISCDEIGSKIYYQLENEIKKNNLINIIKILNIGFDINAFHNYYGSLLHIAVENNKFDIVKYLIENKINVNLVNKHNTTSLIEAFRSNNICIINYLMQNNADINIIQTNGRSCLYYAIINNNLNLVKLLLIKKINLENNYVCQAYFSNDKKIFNYYLNNGYSINDGNVDEHLNTILISLCYNNTDYNIEQIIYLISIGIDINKQNKYGYTALHIACSNGFFNIVKILIENKANIHLVNCYNKTSFQLAYRYKYFDICDYINANS